MLILLLSLLVLSIEYVSAQGNCVTPNQKSGHCIYLNQCPEIYDVIRTQRENLTQNQIKYFRKSKCGQNNEQVLVCCRDVTESTEENQTQQQEQDIEPAGNNLNFTLFPKLGSCGRGAHNRIFGGAQTDIDEYPWLALLEYTQDSIGHGFHCGGSLINNRYVLTAGHCITRANVPPNWLKIRVRLGEWNTDTSIDCKEDYNGVQDCSDPPINVPVESVIVHENYNKIANSKYYDIALLRLANTVQFTDFISPICLPFTDNLRNSNLDGFVFDVAGWGRTENKSKSNIKLKATVTTVDLQTCKSLYAQSHTSLERGQICAGEKNGDACVGDSGGPLIGLDNSNKKQIHHFLAGIVSFGQSCGLEGWPSVYTRVGHYIDWLQRNMKP